MSFPSIQPRLYPRTFHTAPPREAPEHPPMEVASRTMERRAKIRYPVELTVRYHTLGKGRPVAGVGRTLNMSSSGLLVASQSEINPGASVAVSVDWPTLLHGAIRLQLVAVGRVVRCKGMSFAVGFEKHEFRTMKRMPESSVKLRTPKLLALATRAKTDAGVK